MTFRFYVSDSRLAEQFAQMLRDIEPDGNVQEVSKTAMERIINERLPPGEQITLPLRGDDEPPPRTGADLPIWDGEDSDGFEEPH
jgi:hypothetical protein